MANFPHVSAGAPTQASPIFARAKAPVVPPCATPRGYLVQYHRDETNHCPGCSRTHWLVGRISAECAFCGTALPLAEAVTTSHPMPILHRRRVAPDAAWAA